MRVLFLEKESERTSSLPKINTVNQYALIRDLCSKMKLG
jgi:hypothetical protein